MKKTIVATTVAGALKIIVRKEGKKDRELRTIQKVKEHLDAQSVLVAEKEIKGYNWTQIKKELLALKESLKTLKRAKLLLEETKEMEKKIREVYDKKGWMYAALSTRKVFNHTVRNDSVKDFENLGGAKYILKEFVNNFDELELKNRKSFSKEGEEALQETLQGKFSFEKPFEKGKKEFLAFIKKEVKKNIQQSSWNRKRKEEYLGYDSLEGKLLALRDGGLGKKKITKIFAGTHKEFPAYLMEKSSHMHLEVIFEIIKNFENNPEYFYYSIKKGWLEEPVIERTKKQRELFIDGWTKLSKKVPKIAALFGAAHQEPETIVEIFDFKNLKKALELVPTKVEAMLMTVFMQEKVLLLTKKEACNLAQALVEEWEVATNTAGEELDRIIPQKELLWKFKNENIDFLKKLINSIGPEGDVNGLLEKTKREVRKFIASMDVMNVFDYFQEEYGVGDLETLSCSIPETKIEMEGLTARVLAANDPLQVAMGDDSLGGITCCQCKGGAGETCVAEGLQNPNSGFFGIWDEKGLIAQAWLWTTQSREVLVFDNIELNKGRRVDFDKIEKILLEWCEAAPYQKIQLGLGYTKLNTTGFREVKDNFVMGDFEFDPYTDADEHRVWLKNC